VSRGSPAASAELADPELAKYSDRFLPGYERRSLLGRGGCAVVWLAFSSEHNSLVAVKQVLKGTTMKHRSDMESARREMAVAELFWSNGRSRVDEKQYPGITYVAETLDFQETKTDIWVVMEFGGKSLSKALYDVKGEFHRGTRIYRVNQMPFYTALRNENALKDFLRQVLLALDLLTCYGVVHSDLKPDNILIREDGSYFTARLIDFGSAFSFDYPETLGMATPEYMAPEALELVSSRSRSRHREDEFWASMQPWSLDMWSLGCIFLEIISGVPIWMSYTVRAGDCAGTTTGLFAVNGRDPEKIRQKQYDVVQKLTRVVANAPGMCMTDPDGLDLLKRMLAWNPTQRISPEQAMEHPYLV
jgi:dual specificity tyrosine-phosphorylation-regulated kinase 2/3/4